MHARSDAYNVGHCLLVPALDIYLAPLVVLMSIKASEYAIN
jgi:hypothetical protein